MNTNMSTETILAMALLPTLGIGLIYLVVSLILKRL